MSPHLSLLTVVHQQGVALPPTIVRRLKCGRGGEKSRGSRQPGRV